MALPSFRRIRETLASESDESKKKPGVLKCLVLYGLISGAYVFHSLSAVDRKGRKTARQLASYPQGTYLYLIFRDGSQCYGHLGPLSATSFALREVTRNDFSQIPYNDVASVRGVTAPSSNVAPLFGWILLVSATAAVKAAS